MSVLFNPQGVGPTSTSTHAVSLLEKIISLVMLGLVAAEIYLVWLGLGSWPELTLLSLGMIGLTWAMATSHCSRPRA